jgi:uncharacterized protein (TIGR00369 family)
VTTEQLSSEEIARLHEAIASVPYAHLLGIEIVRLERGEATLSLHSRPELMRMAGIMHGGALASLMDSASAFAALTVLGADVHTVTVDLTLHFLRPVTEGLVEAHARVLRAGRRIITVSIEAVNLEGKTVATALTTYLRIP